MKLEIVCLLIFLGGLAVIGSEDRRSAEVTAKVVAASPRPITHYSIKQDSPGLDRGYERNPLPLTHPLETK